MEIRHLAHRAKGYIIYNNELYHRSISGILERCNPVEEGMVLLLDIHESMVEKAFWQCFYRSTATSDMT
jgi:hypothetical protein